ncbi:MAG: 1-(5-phosphoribosyl)-5-[(5-phosphoribosylamino)methylideneamino]imidazole-4-carboxamide isomerase [Chloroflexi bacterium]|nr:1-(5-phosphoribosyl)-5-[(5-phosphoribosylamino)methylideneamino]imidazole-4-carboxamide isomerase [Chloroflexota bacterium]
MIVFPAIDLRRGRCVRLQQGDPDAETVFDDDPVAAARRWQAQGARWLHVVNLDGAFGEGRIDLRSLYRGITADLLESLPVNWRLLHSISRGVSIPIQFGGGLRTLDHIRLALMLGATRVILGTIAVREPDMVRQALAHFGPERIIIGIDARDGRVATHGWKQTRDIRAIDLAKAMKDAGARRIVYTDIARDGMLTGVNVEATAQLARETGLRVIASGGVKDLDDIRALAAHRRDGVDGVIVGQALYTGRLDLARAIEIAEGR